MRNYSRGRKEKSVSYDLSISDLMTAVCCIFLLFLIYTVLNLNKKTKELESQKIKMAEQTKIYESKNGKAEEYFAMQKELKVAIENEFSSDFAEDKWNAYVSDDLTIHFRDEKIMFTANETVISDEFKEILNSFFPRLIKVISSEQFCDDILEIRIEGHTARNPGDTIEVDYKKGMNTSQERTTNVLFYCLENTILLEDTIKGIDSYQWVRQHIAAIGYSNSLPAEDVVKSRRVEIKIRTSAEKYINDIRDIEL